ncbi:DUF4861 family protein [Glaciecola sp. SC05]|uniref:DUF4861 family protein n=1 Tax=Glaciecola sp. SC05 TaxID=1987355 RepID=UPI0035271127
MKSKSIVCVSLFVALSSLMACSQPAPVAKTFTVSNSHTQAFTDVPLVLSRQQVENKLGKLNDNEHLSLLANSVLLSSQLDDLDQDGSWDELAFLINIDAASQQVVELRVSENAKPVSKEAFRTNIQIGKFTNEDKNAIEELTSLQRFSQGLEEGSSRQYQMEGPAWENDNIGFRLYFDERNGFDIFGKTSTDMVLGRVGINQNYHERQTWGMDILKVGRSLGSGALAFSSQNGEAQSLIRLSGAESTAVNIISEGPVRSIFSLNYQNLPVAAQSIQLTQRLSIWAGQHYYSAHITIDQPLHADLGVGIVNFHSLEAKQSLSETHAILSTFGEQAEEATLLGMAVVSERSQHTGFGSVGETPEGIEHSYFSLHNMSLAQELSYDFYSVWQVGTPSINSAEDFQELIEQDQSRKLAITLGM